MNNQRIDDLVRQVMEIEELDRPEGAQLRLAGQESGSGLMLAPKRRSWLLVSSGLAAAAALAVAVILPMRSAVTPGGDRGTSIAEGTPGESSGTDGGSELIEDIRRHYRLDGPEMVIRVEDEKAIKDWMAQARTVSQPMLDPSQVQTCIVVAIYRDQVGAMHCVQYKPHEWPGNQCLNEISSHDLRSVQFDGMPCSGEGRQLLVVALSGPRRSLPTTEIGAVALAKCILGKPRSCDGEGSCFSGIATQCVPTDVSVKVETVAAR